MKVDQGMWSVKFQHHDKQTNDDFDRGGACSEKPQECSTVLIKKVYWYVGVKERSITKVQAHLLTANCP